MEIHSLPKYFLCANSADGFINGFKAAYDIKEGWQAYLIKGGPGTGKSSFMKKAAEYAVNMGYKAELIVCSSDTDSVDGVIFPEIKKVILDATAPHTVEPSFPGVGEEILDFGSFWDSQILNERKEKILELTEKNKELHKKAARFITAAGAVKRREMRISLLAADIDKTFDYAIKLAKKYIKGVGKGDKERQLYLSAVTPKGNVCYTDVIDCCDLKVVISDRFNTVANMFFSVIRDYALKMKYEIITVKNNLLPEDVIDGIIIPELSLAFYLDNGRFPNIKKLTTLRFYDREIINQNRGKLAFGRKLTDELLKAAISTLNEAKECHDRLEAYYIRAMDFEALNMFFKEFCDNVIDF